MPGAFLRDMARGCALDDPGMRYIAPLIETQRGATRSPWRGNLFVIKGIVFDMDGVLVDSEPLHMAAWRAALAEHNLSYSDHWFANWVGVPDSELAKHLIAQHRLDVSSIDLRDSKRACFRRLATSELKPFAGVLSGLASLRRTCRIGCATGSARREAEHGLEAAGLLPFMDALVTADDVARSKPFPDTYEQAARELGLAPAQCLAVEDSPTGVESAARAGCRVVAVLTTHAESELNAERVFPDMAAALHWLEVQVRGVPESW